MAHRTVRISPLRRSMRRRADDGHPGGLEALGRADLVVAAVLARPLVEGVEQAVHLEVGEREHVAQAAGEQRDAVAHRGPAAHQLDPHGGERVEVERHPLGGADELRGGQPPGAGEVLDLVVPLVPHARVVHPPQHVAAAVDAGHPHVLADREDHLAAGPLQLGGELHAGRRRADHEHAALGERVGPAVVERRDLDDLRRHALAEPGHVRAVAGAARQHHRAGAELAVARGQVVAVVGAPYRGDVHAGADGGAGERGEALDELDHLGHGHVAVRVRAVVVEARQAALPVRGEEAEGVPALPPPGVRHLTAFEHDVVDRPFAEEVARREAGMAGPDDDRGDSLDDGARTSQATSTVTSVGLVRASNTAERFWDWATRASISSREASASMWNVTLMSL